MNKDTHVIKGVNMTFYIKKNKCIINENIHVISIIYNETREI